MYDKLQPNAQNIYLENTFLFAFHPVSQQHVFTFHPLQPPQQESQLSRVFSFVSGLYTFLLPTLCLRFAYAVAVSAYAGLLCLDLPMRAYTYRYILDFTYAACIWCFCGSAFCLVFSCFAYAGLGRYGHLVPIRVVPN